MTTLWLCADGSREIGLGHVMRMVALAQAAGRYGLQANFVTKDDPVAAEMPGRFGFDRIPPDEWLAEDLAGHAVVFDGYTFTSEDHRDAADRGAVVAAMDDYGSGRFDVDLLVNQNLVDKMDFLVPAHARTLIGPRYALLREEFLAHRRRRNGMGDRLLVTFGGSDTARVAARVTEVALEHGFFSSVTLLAGPGGHVDVPAEVHVVSDPFSVAAVFDTVDAAISAAGSTTWELLCCGVPTALVQTEDNQQHVARPLQLRRTALFLGHVDDLDLRILEDLADPGIRRGLSDASLRLIDGWGAHRVAATLRELVNPS